MSLLGVIGVVGVLVRERKEGSLREDEKRVLGDKLRGEGEERR